LQPQALAVAYTPEGLPDLKNPQTMEVVRAIFAKNCSPAEMATAIHLAERYGLDPLAKEVWAIKRQPSEPALIMVSRDGLLKAAKRDPQFQGLSSGVVKAGDEFAFDPVAGTVAHRFGEKRGDILGAWALAKHKSRDPVAVFVDFREYRGNSPIWSKYPSAMIEKTAQVVALKRQFDLTGLRGEDEGEDVGDAQASAPAVKRGAPPPAAPVVAPKPVATVEVEPKRQEEQAQVDAATLPVIEAEIVGEEPFGFPADEVDDAPPPAAVMTAEELREWAKASGLRGVDLAKSVAAVGGEGAKYADLDAAQKVEVVMRLGDLVAAKVA